MMELPPDITAKVRTLVEEAWLASPRESGWSPRVTIPFPVQWNGQPTAVVWYAYADRNTPERPGALEVGSVWGKVSMDVEDEAPGAVEILAPIVEVVGFQDVRPLSQAQIAAIREGAAARLKLPSGQPTEALKAGCKFWCATQGRIYASIAPHHPEFAAWLRE